MPIPTNLAIHDATSGAPGTDQPSKITGQVVAAIITLIIFVLGFIMCGLYHFSPPCKELFDRVGHHLGRWICCRCYPEDEERVTVDPESGSKTYTRERPNLCPDCRERRREEEQRQNEERRRHRERRERVRSRASVPLQVLRPGRARSTPGTEGRPASASPTGSNGTTERQSPQVRFEGQPDDQSEHQSQHQSEHQSEHRPVSPPTPPGVFTV